jgi:hypothetical protein
MALIKYLDKSWPVRWIKKFNPTAKYILKLASAPTIILFASIIPLTKWSYSLVSEANKNIDEVKKIRGDLEQQNETMRVLLRDSNRSYSEIQRVEQKTEDANKQIQSLDKLVTEAQSSIIEINDIIKFNNTLMMASNDDRDSLITLSHIIEEEKNPFKDLAYKSILYITSQLSNGSGSRSPWMDYKMDPSEVTIKEVDLFYPKLNPKLKAGIIRDLDKSNKITTRQKLNFLMTVLREEKSLLALNAACEVIDKRAKLSKNVLGWNEYLKWCADEIDIVNNTHPLVFPIDAFNQGLEIK